MACLPGVLAPDPAERARPHRERSQRQRFAWGPAVRAGNARRDGGDLRHLQGRRTVPDLEAGGRARWHEHPDQLRGSRPDRDGTWHGGGGRTPCPRWRVERGLGGHPPRRRPIRRLLPRRGAHALMSAADRVLTLRELNRATLARQMLLERENASPLEAVGRLVALQAQVTSPPTSGSGPASRTSGAKTSRG